MIWPFAAVEPRRYRLRLLNGSDSRFYDLAFEPRLRFFLIGTELGFLDHPVALDRLVLAPAERADVIVDFGHPAVRGRQVLLLNAAPTPFPGGDPPDPRTTGRVMAFRVGASAVKDGSRIPDRLRPEPLPELRPTAAIRELVLLERKDEFGRSKTLLGTARDGAKAWAPDHRGPAARRGGGLGHLQHHRRQPSDPRPPRALPRRRTSTLRRRGGSSRRARPDPVARATSCRPARTSAVQRTPCACRRARALESSRASIGPGAYVWHCHILSHEDHEMMRPFLVREEG